MLPDSWPSASHSSSARWGAKGESSSTSGSRMARLWVPRAVSSFTAIMKVLTLVLKLNLSMSCATFWMTRCSAFNSAGLAASSVTARAPSSGWKSRQNFLRNVATPLMPLVFQGLNCSSGPRNIS